MKEATKEISIITGQAIESSLMRDDSILYHYTTIEALNSIIRSGKVWASDCHYLNDQHELALAQKMFLARFTGDIHKALSLAFDWHSHSRHQCVFSLSRSPEVLSQWRVYADDGCGAAIGFRSKYVSGRECNPARFLIICVYQDHEEFIDNLINQYRQEIEDLVRMSKSVERNLHYYTFFGEEIDKNPKPLETLNSELLRIKNRAFAEEQEVRIVLNVPKKQVQTRVTKGLIIPYVEHAFMDESDHPYLDFFVPEIWLGPKCDERNMHAIKTFLHYGWNSNNWLHRYDCGYI